MAGARDIRAGGAYVEISARDGEFLRGLSRAQGQLRSFASSCASIGSSLLAVSGAALAPLGLATSAFAGFDDAMRSVAAVTGATGEQFDGLTAKARELGAATRYTAQDAAGAMLALGRAGMDTRQIDASVQSVLALATATGTDLAQSAEIVANTLNMFGLAAERSGHAADVLTATANGSAQTLADLFESLRMVGPQAKAAGYSLEETSAALGVLANVGLKGSMAGNALKRALQQFADPATQKKLAEIGVSVKTAEGELRALPAIFRDLAVAMNDLPGADKLALAKDIFDVRASGAGLNLAANVDALDAFLAKLRDVDGAATRTEASMNAGIGGALAALKSAAQDVALSVGNALAPALQKLADEWRGNLNAFSEWVSAHRETIIVVAKAAAVVGAFATAMIALSGVFRALATATAILKVAMLPLVAGWGKLLVLVPKLAYALEGLRTVELSLATVSTATAATIGAMAAAIAGTVAVAAGFVYAFGRLTTHAVDFNNAAQMTLDRHDALRQSTKDYFTRLKELAAQESLTADEMAEADDLVAKLSERYADLGIAVDRAAGKITGLADAQRKANALMREAEIRELDAAIRQDRKISADAQQALRDLGHWYSVANIWTDADKIAEGGMQAEERILANSLRLRALRAAAGEDAAPAPDRGAVSARAEDTTEVAKAREEIERLDEAIRREGLSSLGRQIDDIEKARDKYVAAAQAVIDFENAQAEQFRDYETIAEMQEKIAARQLAAEKAIAEAREKAARAGTDALDRLAEAEADYAAARERRDEDRRLDELSKTDGAGYLAEVSRLLAAAKSGAADAATAYRTAVEGAMADGEMTDEERRAVDALLETYREAEAAVDRFAERLARAGEAAKDSTGSATGRLGATGSFYAAAAAGMAGGYMVRLVDAQESTKNNTKRILDLIKDGALEMRYA